MQILVINGPNLNLLGVREKGIYGTKTLEDINGDIMGFCKNHNVDVEFFQSNHEGDIIDAIHNARLKYDGIVINAGAYTHYSIAISDAIRAVDIPVVEVHISNVQAREEYRHKSVISGACLGVIAGFGEYSYILGIMAIVNEVENKNETSISV